MAEVEADKGGGGAHDKIVKIQIDRTTYKVEKEKLTGAEIRRIPNPPIEPDRDLFEVVAGGTDVKIEDTATVKMHHGLRFFTAPAHINPGAR